LSFVVIVWRILWTFFKPTLSFRLLECTCMKKAAVIIIAVAILGLLAFKTQGNKGNSTPDTSSTQTLTTNSQPANSTSAINSQAPSAGSYKDGTYQGSSSSTPYGNVQVAAVISGGKIVDIAYIQMPDSEHESVFRTNLSEPRLKQSAIANQSAHIDFVSGATDTSYGFEQSLQSALDKAASA
jgi:uncharacterized protein with FMN-binding domain